MKPMVKNEDGFSLIELMIVVALTGIIAAAAYAAYVSQQKTYYSQSDVVQMQQNLRAGIEIAAMDIRMAGYDPDNTGNFSFTNNTGPGKIEFQVDRNGGETIAISLGSSDDNSDGFIEKEKLDGNSDGRVDPGVSLVRDLNGSGAQAIAEGIQAVEFYYTLKNGARKLNPAANELDKIRSINVTVLAVAPAKDNEVNNSAIFTTASGATWGPFNDNYRRRITTYNINCRNMGL